MIAAHQQLFLDLVDQARQSSQRRLLVISGERDWARDLLSQFTLSTTFERRLYLTDKPIEESLSIPIAKAQQFLGQELDCLVYDCFAGLNPDALGAAGGSVVAGGLLILLTPELDEWQNFLDPDYERLLVHPFKQHQIRRLFLKRFAQTIGRAKSAVLISEKAGCHSAVTSINNTVQSQETLVESYCATTDQQEAVNAIVKVVKGHRRRPLVIQSDRGRGKSASLGIASAQLLQGQVKQILVSAPRLASVKPVFEHAASILGVSLKDAGLLEYEGSSLRFVAPDALLRQLPKADLVLIDEAAAIPLAILEPLLTHYSRLVFATTVHGYEGTGRGFSLRFSSVLDEKTPQWKRLAMNQAIRWQKDDPVEAWLFDALLLNARLSTIELPVDVANCDIEELDRKQFLQQEGLLEQVFSLLVLAHYQTTPSDLRNILDGPNIRVWVVRDKGRLLATALVTDEGGFDAQISGAIWKGERRLRGHLLAQTLSAHSGIEAAPTLRYQRIMRIAVHPTLQRQGIGQALLKAVAIKAEQLKIDVLGSSFGATSEVLHFWQYGGLLPVRLGVSRDSCSGTHSALVLKPLTLSGEMIVDTVRFRFLEQFPHQLMTQFQHVEPELVAGLMLGNDYYETIIIDEQDWLDVTAFTEGYRVFEVCSVPLWKMVCSFMGQLEVRQWLSDTQRDLLVYILLQNRPMSWVAKELGYTGKKELITALRGAIKLLSQQQMYLRSTLLH